MSTARTWIFLTVCAAALGGLAGAVVIVLTPRAPVTSDHPAGDEPSPPGTAPAAAPPEQGGERPATTPRGGGSPPVTPGLTSRIDDPDPAVRNATALELLRRGPEALAQARALRPSTPAGMDLQNRLVAALDKMTLLRRANDYPKLPDRIRLKLDLDAFASVVPEDLLVAERVAFWTHEIDAVQLRLDAGHADPGERALAELELAYARRESGDVDAAAYARSAEERLPAIEGWVDAQRRARSAAPAQIRELEAQVARLRP